MLLRKKLKQIIKSKNKTNTYQYLIKINLSITSVKQDQTEKKNFKNCFVILQTKKMTKIVNNKTNFQKYCIVDIN